MVLLFDIPFDELKTVPFSLWSKPINGSDGYRFLFSVIGCVKYFHKNRVIFFLVFIHFYFYFLYRRF